jgi:hypothetical protein
LGMRTDPRVLATDVAVELVNARRCPLGAPKWRTAVFPASRVGFAIFDTENGDAAV